MNKLIKYPPIVSFFFFAVMILISLCMPLLSVKHTFMNGISVVFFIGSFLIVLSAAVAFKKVQTTIDPTTPEKTSALVTSGIYAYSRNPMYLGILGGLIGSGLLLGNLLNLFLFPLYIMTMNKLFIKPEEKILESIFESAFVEYKQKVRRWI